MVDLKDAMQGDSGWVARATGIPWIELKLGRNAEEVSKNLCFATGTVAHCSDWQLVMRTWTRHSCIWLC